MAFSLSKLTVATGLATGTLLTCIGEANAVGFGFNFDTNYSQNNGPKGSTILESIAIGDKIINEFSYINSAAIVYNDPHVKGDINSGAASADIGDSLVSGVNTQGVKVEDATAADIVTNLSTNDLNNIIDTEDDGTFVIDLKFGKTIDNLLIWERGMNSKIGIQAVDADGNLIGTRRVIEQNMWFDAGYSIDTKEIGSAQKVGSLGINIAQDLGVDSGRVETIRFFSEGKEFNGPDWKFVGTDADRDLEPEAVPEPALILGLSVFGGVLMLKKRAQVA
jgi:hypothetical protein